MNVARVDSAFIYQIMQFNNFTWWIHSPQSVSLYVLFWSLCLFFSPAPQTSGTKTESKVMQPTCGTLKLLRKTNPSHPLSYQPATFLRKWTTQKKEKYLISTVRKEKETRLVTDLKCSNTIGIIISAARYLVLPQLFSIMEDCWQAPHQSSHLPVYTHDSSQDFI